MTVLMVIKYDKITYNRGKGQFIEKMGNFVWRGEKTLFYLFAPPKFNLAPKRPLNLAFSDDWREI